jgi:hypothetical protein
MKIDKIIFACDDNPLYKDFWAITSEICYKKLGVTPVLFHITDENTDFYEDTYGIVKKVKRVDGVNTGFQSQIIRMFGCKYFMDEVCLTSDIDMLMFNKEYFLNQIEVYDNDSFIIYSSDAYGNKQHRYPICYNASLGKNFVKILKCDCDFLEYTKRLKKYRYDWSCDEFYFTEMIKKSGFEKIIKLNRGWVDNRAVNRIDRVKWEWSEEQIGEYIDCHSIRPYIENKEEIEKLKKVILSGC